MKHHAWPLRILLVVASIALAFGSAAQVPPAPPAPGAPVRLRGHTDAVLAAAFTPDAKRVVTGSNDGTAAVWDVATGKRLHKLEGHAFGVTAVAVSGDGKRLVTGSIDHTARVWDVATGDLLAMLNAKHYQHVHAVAISPDGTRVLTGSCDHTAVLWDVAAEKPLQTFDHPGEVWGVGFLADGKQFFTACHEGEVRNDKERNDRKTLFLYDSTTLGRTKEFRVPMIDNVSPTADGRRVVCSSGRALVIVDLETGQLKDVSMMAFRDPFVDHVAPSPDGALAVTASRMTVELVDVAARERDPRSPAARNSVRTFPKPREDVRAVAISPDKQWALVGGGGMGAPWFNGYTRATETDAHLFPLAAPAGESPAPRFFVGGPGGPRRPQGVRAAAADGSRLVTLDYVGRVTAWDPVTARETGHVEFQGPVATLVMTPDARRFVVREPRQGWVAVYDVPTRAETRIGGPTDPLSPLAITADGKILATVDVPPPPPPPATPATRRAGIPAARAARPKNLRLWDVATRSEIRRIPDLPTPWHRLAFTPDGGTLLAVTTAAPSPAAAAADAPAAAAIAWDVATGKQLWTIPAGRPNVPAPRMASTGGALAISPDGQFAAFAHYDVTTVVETRTGKVVVTLDRSKSCVLEIAFDLDGTRIWTASEQDAARAYDRRTGKLLVRIGLGDAKLMNAQFVLGDHRRALFDVTPEAVNEYDLTNP